LGWAGLSRPERANEQDACKRLRELADARNEAQAAVDLEVVRLRDSGVGWVPIAAVLRISRQGSPSRCISPGSRRGYQAPVAEMLAETPDMGRQASRQPGHRTIRGMSTRRGDQHPRPGVVVTTDLDAQAVAPADQSRQPSVDEPASLMTVDEVAAHLATPVRFVRRLITQRRIGFCRIGRYVRISRADLEALIEAGRVAPLENKPADGPSAPCCRAQGTVR
jgi:excisionase family DNA binding protein